MHSFKPMWISILIITRPNYQSALGYMFLASLSPLTCWPGFLKMLAESFNWPILLSSAWFRNEVQFFLIPSNASKIELEYGMVWYSSRCSLFPFRIPWFTIEYRDFRLFLFLCRRKVKGCHFIQIIISLSSPFPCLCCEGWERIIGCPGTIPVCEE